MISRVAGNCFWLLRYMERVENTSRMVRVNLSLVLEVQAATRMQWRPLLIVAGEEPRFLELIGEDKAEDGDAVQDYLIWDERNPSSVVSSLRWARDNARTIRETISLEMWYAINDFWLWLSIGKAAKLYRKDRDAFYTHLIDRCQLFHGLCHNTILTNAPYDFMRMGMMLERAGQTARILDVKYHSLGPTRPDEETEVEAVQWLALLRTCGGMESFFKLHSSSPSGPAVASFLLFEEHFPRAVLHCLGRALDILESCRPDDAPFVGEASSRKLRGLVTHMREKQVHSLFPGIHQELTHVIDTTTAICGTIHQDFFDPVIPPWFDLGIGRPTPRARG